MSRLEVSFRISLRRIAGLIVCNCAPYSSYLNPPCRRHRVGRFVVGGLGLGHGSDSGFNVKKFLSGVFLRVEPVRGHSPDLQPEEIILHEKASRYLPWRCEVGESI